jgi:DNA modification methylase
MRISLTEIALPDKLLDSEQQAIIESLAESMKEIGLSHPVILRNCSSSERFEVVAGERRIRAAKHIGWRYIEAEIRNVDDTNAAMIRIHENLRRHNLPWHEQVRLVEELHNLRQKEHGIGKVGKPALIDGEKEKKGWSLRDTAKELQVALGPLSEDIVLSRALKADPTLAKVKDKRTAIKLARIAINRGRAELESTPFSTIEDAEGLELNQTYFGDAVEILRQFPARSIDHCITDPPWIKFFDPKLRLDKRTLPVFKELYRVLKPGAFVYIFAGMDDYFYYAGYDVPEKKEIRHEKGELEKIGFKCSLTPIVWHKVNSMSRRGVRPWEYDRDYEFIIVAAKGDPVLTEATRLSGVKPYPVVPSPNLTHPNEKPIELIRALLDECSYENNIIIDPFAGSGVLGEACQQEGRRYVLIERERKYYEGIVKRLGESDG